MKTLLKRFTVALLIFAVFASNFSFAFVYAGFKLNEQYIAKNLCINRLNPSLHCNGKCYFIRKLKAAGDKEKSGQRQSQKNLLQASVFTQIPNVHFYSSVLQVMQQPDHCIMLPLIDSPIFQPPPIS
jgi:hypothetical protein